MNKTQSKAEWRDKDLRSPDKTKTLLGRTYD